MEFARNIYVFLQKHEKKSRKVRIKQNKMNIELLDNSKIRMLK